MVEKQPKILIPDDVSQKLRAVCRESSNGITVIFGAGASHGYSRNQHKFLPPTVAQLFDDSSNAVVLEILNQPKHNQIRGLKPAIERGLKSFGGNLEKYLSDIYCDNKDNNLFSLLIVYLQDLFFFASRRARQAPSRPENLCRAL